MPYGKKRFRLPTSASAIFRCVRGYDYVFTRAHWTGDKESNSGLPSPPAVAGDDDSPSFFGSSKKPNSMGHEVESFIPSKMGYLHIKNQVLLLLLLLLLL